MKPELPPTGRFRAGQDFQTMRAKYRQKGVESANYADGACGGPKPADVWKGQTRALKGDVKSEKIGSKQPSFQKKYGEDRSPLVTKQVK